jgi:hypothetical protein
MWMQVSGPNRFVRIVINRSKADPDLEVIGSLGHELQHAVEVLREPAVTNGVTMFNSGPGQGALYQVVRDHFETFR